MLKQTTFGQVVSIEVMGHGLRHMHVKLDNGQFETYFEEFKDTYNKSLKVGDRVKVAYQFSNFVNSSMSKKPTKVKKPVGYLEDLARLLKLA